MTSPYRDAGQKEPSELQGKIARAWDRSCAWVKSNPIDFGFLAGMTVLSATLIVFMIYVVVNHERLAREELADRAVNETKAKVCDVAGQKNAAAWAKFMGIKSPAISCRWNWKSGCDEWLNCAVGNGDGSAVYPIRCHSGDGMDREGDQGACELTPGRR